MSNESAEIALSDSLTRFVRHSSWVRSDKTVKSDAFIPQPSLKLSVMDRADLQEPQIWRYGEATMELSGATLHGRADFRAEHPQGLGLKIEADPTPLNKYHAHITGWPPKPQQKLLAVEIAGKSIFVSPPAGAPSAL